MTIKSDGTILSDHYKPLYRNVICLAGIHMTNVKADQPFRIFVSNIGDHPVDVLPKNVATTSMQPEKRFASQMLHAKIIGLILDSRYTQFRKPHSNVLDIKKVSKHLADQLE